MRLDYALYVLGALILIITVVPFVVTIEGVESETRSLWVVTTVVLGLLFIGLGYSQRPKKATQTCQLATTTLQETAPQTPPALIIETPTATAALELTQVKGIGEKRATQLKIIGINNVGDLAKTSAEDIAKKLQISPKITRKWIANAQELVK